MVKQLMERCAPRNLRGGWAMMWHAEHPASYDVSIEQGWRQSPALLHSLGNAERARARAALAHNSRGVRKQTRDDA